MRIVCGNSWAPPAVQEEDFAAPSTSVLPVAWREICKEPVKVFSALFDVFNLDRDAARPVNYSAIKKNNAA